jgi:hypothetical protein
VLAARRPAPEHERGKEHGGEDHPADHRRVFADLRMRLSMLGMIGPEVCRARAETREGRKDFVQTQSPRR